ncbi:hypothetical protein MLD38_007697 [Melastoma candidum]|uniref:Uncharacterized protein n=1 Tax=Melastoma candidum TaxID=119954 RepID=A0ACB9RRW1_9MYRT|nr:hypothetical protein MLD38_007697 [Melastoma candidum]
MRECEKCHSIPFVADPDGDRLQIPSPPSVDVSQLLAKCDDLKMGEDPAVAQVVRSLDQACWEAGFFYVYWNNAVENLNVWPCLHSPRNKSVHCLQARYSSRFETSDGGICQPLRRSFKKD